MINKLQKMMSNKKGFTLIELIVVIAIIAILVGLATPRFLGYTKDAQVAAMQADSKTLSNGALQYAIKNSDALPVADSQVDVTVIPDSELDLVIEEAKTQQGVTTDVVLSELDQVKIGAFYKSLKNPITKYVIVTSNDALQGEVFYIGDSVTQKVLVDSVGNINSGIYTVAP